MDQFHIKGNQERLNRLHLEGRNTKGYFENDHNNVGTSANASFINYQNVFDKNPYRINEIDAINAIENINTISAINNDILALQVGSVNADSQQDSQIYNFKTSDLPLFSDESVCSSTNFDNTTIFTENVNKLAGLTLDTNKKLSDKTNYNLVNYNEELFSKIFDKNPNPFLNVGFYGDANQVLEKNQKPSYGFGDKVEGDMIFTPQPDMQINHDTIFTTKNKDVGILSATLGSDINDAMHNNEVDTFIKNYEMLDAQTLTLGSSGITGISSERVDQTHTLQTVIPAGFNFNHEGINRQNHFKNDAEHVLWKYEPQYSRSLNSTPNSLLFSKKPPRGRRVGSKSTKSKDMINAILQNKFNPQLINAAMRKTNFCNAKTTASDSGLQYKNNIYIPRYPPTSTEPNASDNPIPKFNGLVQVGMDHLNVCDVAVTKKQVDNYTEIKSLVSSKKNLGYEIKILDDKAAPFAGQLLRENLLSGNDLLSYINLMNPPNFKLKKIKGRNPNSDFECPVENCTSKFKKLYSLKSHILSHSSLRPFECKYCGVAFTRNHDLKRHIKIHTGDKPYTCEFCFRGFARTDALNRHYSSGSCCARKVTKVSETHL